MGLTERHWFENEDVPENYEWDLEDAVYNSCTNKKPEDSVLMGKGGMTMPDREKVIKGLECCAGQCNYHGCPYKDPCENANGVKQIMLDAITLLKEQEETELCDRCGRVRLKSEWEAK
jgi:hypothetical protein